MGLQDLIYPAYFSKSFDEIWLFHRIQEVLESINQWVCMHYAVIGWPTINFSNDFESSKITLILALKYIFFYFLLLKFEDIADSLLLSSWIEESNACELL